MRIKSLHITGFKSFVDETRFNFGSGISGIVGPNGCGKSNVVDAIRWAMGEQSPRRLRGKGMDDVIFVGSDARAPVGRAEVVLTFDNSDGLAPPEFSAFSEIEVARRLYKTGESEYLLNKTPCRLRDVLDFFRDTGIGTKGYTIVEQGRIAEIVSAKPEERRTLIEEAAGISKYKARRRESELKLKSTETNLVRVRDVLGEIRRQITSTTRQARRAARYKRLVEQQRVLELALAAEERAQLTAALEEARGALGSSQGEELKAEARLAECEADVENRRIALTEKERSAAEAGEALFQVRSTIKELEGRIAYEQRERASLAELEESRMREREKLEQRLRDTEEERVRLAAEAEELEAALDKQDEAKREAEAAAREAEEKLRVLTEERESGNRKLVEALTQIARSEDRLTVLHEKRSELDRNLRGMEEQLELRLSEGGEVEAEQRELEQGLQNLLALRDRLMGELRDAGDASTAGAEEVKGLVARLRERREKREMCRARLTSLHELTRKGEDLSTGVRTLGELPEAERARLGLRGLVRDALEVEDGFEQAVFAAAGRRSEAMVIAAGVSPLPALAALREGSGGGVLLLEGRARAPGSAVPLGVPLLEKVRVRPGFETVARALLGDVMLLEQLDEALQVYAEGEIPCTFVTPAGELLTPDGVLRGGFRDAPGGAFARAREIRELEAQAQALDAEVEELEAACAAAESAQAAASDALDNLRNRYHTAALAVAGHEKDLDRTRERVKTLSEAQEGHAAQRSDALGENERVLQEIQRVQGDLAEARERETTCQGRLEELGLSIGAAGRECSRLEASAASLRTQHATRAESGRRLGAQLTRVQESIADLRGWIREREGEIESGRARRAGLAESVAAAEGDLAQRLLEEEEKRKRVEGLRDEFERDQAALREVEEKTRELRQELESLRDSARNAEQVRSEREMRLSYLDQQVRDKWNVELKTWQPPRPPDEAPDGEAAGQGEAGEAGEQGEADDDSEAGPWKSEQAFARDARREARELAALVELDDAARRERLAEICARLESIGPVNLGAIEEHEELRERFRFLDEQRDDLEKSVSRLREAIARINRTSRKRFRETFEQVKQQFEKNFPRLFRGGKASLSLTESEDVLEAGIEIMAQPPGKRLQSVNLLSGGEKTMTAIALLVSVFQVRPSPFFLLDEVDAALDDANVARFNEIVREMAGDSQFLMITHNKRTIEIADVLFGVTMEEKGVSKLVSVELN